MRKATKRSVERYRYDVTTLRAMANRIRECVENGDFADMVPSTTVLAGEDQLFLGPVEIDAGMDRESQTVSRRPTVAMPPLKSAADHGSPVA